MTIEVTRGVLVESIHNIHWVVADASGKVVESSGVIDTPVYLRSSTKPFQAIAVLVSGAADAFGLTDAEIAIIGGSHHGEPAHLEAVTSILDKSGIPVEALQCGIHAPVNSEAAKTLRARGEKPGVLHANCSGKHAGMLALARHLEAPLETYLDRDHPTQKLVFHTYGAVFGQDPEAIPFGWDGCGLPAAAVDLKRAAMGFARFASSDQLPNLHKQAATRLRTAVWKHPIMVNGVEGFDTQVIQASPRLVVKNGAEGVFCAGDAVTGLGLALKVADGAYRAVPPAATELLRRLGWLNETALQKLEAFRTPEIKTLAGRSAGVIRVAAERLSLV